MGTVPLGSVPKETARPQLAGLLQATVNSLVNNSWKSGGRFNFRFVKHWSPVTNISF